MPKKDDKKNLETVSPDISSEQERLQEEIDSLKQKCEMLQLGTQSVNSKINIKDAEDVIPKFNGSDVAYSVNKWIDDIEENSVVFDWTPLQTLLIAKKSLEGTAKLWIKSEPVFKTWVDLKQAIREEFQEKVDSRIIHQMLTKRKKTSNETYHDYILQMKEIGRRVNLEDAVIIQYIIDGIVDYEPNKSILYGARTFAEFKEKIKCYETIKLKNQKPLNEKSVSQKFENKTDKLCFNCGGKGHLSRDCKKKSLGTKCFRCNQFGHIASKCSEKSKEAETKEPNTGSFKIKEKTETLLANKDSLSNHMLKVVTIQDNQIKAIIDTGSDVNIMRCTQFFTLGIPNIKQEKLSLMGIGSQEVKTLGNVTSNVIIDGEKFRTTIHIVPDHVIPAPLLIGRELLNEAEVTINKTGIKITKPKVNDVENYVLQIKINDDVICDYSSEIQQLVENYNPNPIKTTEIQTKIILTNEAPIYQHPRRLSIAEKKEVDKQIDEWLENGIVQPSDSDFASPIVLVKKKDGTTRICVDYRKVNEKVIKDRYPLPLIEDQLDRLRNAKLFSTLDLKNGFFHVPVAKECRKYTSFVTPSGQFEFLKTPFGFCNAPAIFQRFINTVFKDLICKGVVLTYMDDLIIPATSHAEGIERLRIVLQRASEYGLEIKWNKCEFLRDKIEYLGYEIRNNEIKPAEKKIIAVKKYPVPTTLKQIQSFLGLTGYFRKFIQNYAQIAKPLSDLLKKNAKFIFGNAQKEAFENLKTVLIQKPVLNIYSPDSRTELHTDASKFGYGAILLQEDSEDGKLHPVYYMSRKTSEAEQKYSSYELEVLAIIEALKKFRVYLLGIPFKIVTDCSAFKMTMQKKELATRVARWALLLAEFSYTIEHRAGLSMKHVDALSRYPVVNIVQAIITNRIQKAQQEDEELRTIMKLLEKSQHDGFFIENKILYKEYQGLPLLVVPKKMQMEIIKAAHQNGHFATRKTQEIILRDYWFAKMKEKIENVIRNCISCILTEKKSGKQEGLLNPISKGDIPLSTYHIDHLGPLSSTKKGYKYILAVVDAFTKFVWIYPTKTTSTEETVSKLEIQRSTFGNPDRVITDKGTSFSSHVFQEYCEKNNIQHIQITTGIPRGNGQIERINRIIIPVLSKLSIEKVEDWYKHVGDLQISLNSTFQRSIGKTPFELMIGVKMKNPKDIKIHQLIAEENITLFEEERSSIREDAKKQIIQVQEENKRNYNRKRKPAKQYQIDDLVAIKRSQFINNAKLRPKFLGPYKIISVTGHDRYEVEKISSSEGPRRTSTAADHMKPWASEEFDEDNELSDTSGSDENQDGRVVGQSGPVEESEKRWQTTNNDE